MQLKLKLYPKPKNVMLFKLESFKYTLSVGLNMGLYHICLGDYTGNICTIIPL